jgi:hypothetical protein
MKIPQERIDQAIELGKSAFKIYVEAVQTGKKEKLDFGEYILSIFFAASHNISVRRLRNEFDGDDMIDATGYNSAIVQKAINSLKGCGIKELYNDDEPNERMIQSFKKGLFNKYHFYQVASYGGFESIFMTRTPIDESLFLLGDGVDKVTKKDVEDFFYEIREESLNEDDDFDED